MAYNKQNFIDGQTLFASHLNHIEEGLKALDSIIASGKIPVDTTLTLAEKAAEAKATGEAIAAIPRVDVSDIQPTDLKVKLWVDTNEDNESYMLPEIADNKISETDTWSSQKIAEEIRSSSSSILNLVYPIGSIYMSANLVSPATLFGGTWTQIKDTFLLAAGNTYAAGSTGGEAEHVLTVDEMPEHSHGLGYRNYKNMTTGGTLSIGGSQPHNNMPPYLTVYMWKRIA